MIEIVAQPPEERETLNPGRKALGLTIACTIPAILLVLGVDLGLPWPPPTGAAPHGGGEFLQAVAGPIVHDLLEWSAFMVALLTTMLAYAHFRATGDAMTLTLSVALLSAGCIDAFHTLAASRLISAAAPQTDFIPFTWAVCRMFNGGLMLIGITVILVKKDVGAGAILKLGGLFVALAAAAIAFATYSPSLPKTMYPDSFVTRPFDLFPLIGFALAGLFAYPTLHRRIGSYFTLALYLSVIPDTATQLHMVFGSQRLFDGHFNASHSLKILAYLVPFWGLAFEYVRTHTKQDKLMKTVEVSRDALETTNKALSHSNRELKSFAYIASHDLQNPLRQIGSFSKMIRSRHFGQLDAKTDLWLDFMSDASVRMQTMIQDLLEYSQLEAAEKTFQEVELQALVDRLRSQMAEKLAETGAEILAPDALPTVMADPEQLSRLLQNLIENALKYQRPGKAPRAQITATANGEGWKVTVADNGIGIAPKYREQIFGVFKRLHKTSEYPGTGIGLASCRRVAEKHGGTIWVEDSELGGSAFVFTLRPELQPRLP